jgi:hypothetical protein
MSSASSKLTLVLLLFVYGIVGCSSDEKGSAFKTSKLPSAAKSILENADQIELVSLDPGNSKRDESPPKGDYFGWKELGRTVITDADIRAKVVSSVEKGIAEVGRPAKCFDPRHAIHASYGDKSVDIIICFHCSQDLVYLDNQEQRPYLPISASPESVLDKILTETNVPLAPKQKR